MPCLCIIFFSQHIKGVEILGIKGEVWNANNRLESEGLSSQEAGNYSCIEELSQMGSFNAMPATYHWTLSAGSELLMWGIVRMTLVAMPFGRN